MDQTSASQRIPASSKVGGRAWGRHVQEIFCRSPAWKVCSGKEKEVQVGCDGQGRWAEPPSLPLCQKAPAEVSGKEPSAKL